MKQVVTRQGEIEVLDVPAPSVRPGTVRVDVRASCISAGTESAGIAASGMSVIERAVRYPDRLRNVAELALRSGIGRTVDDVRAGLSAAGALGYSAAGVVQAVGAGVDRFVPGDRVACAGAGQANHAEQIVVPENLVVPVPDGLEFRPASTVALGAIAMQGVRRAEITMGELVVVIGLGLLGQITAQLLRVAGCRVVGVEPDPRRRALTAEGGALAVLDPGDSDLPNTVKRLSGGHGADAAIITAAGAADQIVSSAFRVCRPKGRVVLVGDVGLGLRREDFYAKELDFRVATSYGPGRYDARYEEGGLDYPIGYVRWTEGRNMEEYLRLLAEDQIVLEPLVQGGWPVDHAAEAYKALSGKNAAPIVFLDYPDAGEAPKPRVELRRTASTGGAVRFAVVGAGGFARGVHLPNLRKQPDAELVAVVSRSGLSARETADRFGARLATTELETALRDEGVDAVIIATRHDLHADQALAALESGRHVLVEKPLALTGAELDRFRAFYAAAEEDGREAPILLTGFNRRFSPAAVRLRQALSSRTGPIMLTYRMNAGHLPADHWVHGPEGGGRNLGEACHVYDLFVSLVAEEAVEVTALPASAPDGHHVPRDNFSASLRFRDGSLCTLTYTATGHDRLGKERLEAFWDGRAAVLDDYRSLTFHGGGEDLRSRRVEKGHAEELAAFVAAVRDGGDWPIPLWQQVEATRIALEVQRQLTGLRDEPAEHD